MQLLTVLAIVLLPISLSAESKFFDSNGVQIHYYDEGEGEPVVLVHGGFSNAAMWDTLGAVDALEEAGWRVIALDMRSHGQSGKPHDPAKYGLEMSLDIGRLLDHLNISRAHVVGYSMGAGVTNRFRVTHPDPLLTATLGGFGATSEESPFVRRASEFADAMARGDVGHIMRVLSPPGQSPTQEQIDAMNRDIGSRNDAQALAAVLRAQDCVDSVDELRANKVPTLALIGEIDPNRKYVDAMVGVMANLTVVVIPRANHGAAIRDPLFLEELLKFLANHRQSTTDD